MVHMLVNFLGLPVLAKQAPEDPHSPHPKDFCWQSSLPSTLAFTISRVTSLSLRLLHSASTRSRMDFSWFPDDEAILYQFPYVLPGVGHGDFTNFIGVEPDFSAAALEDAGG